MPGQFNREVIGFLAVRQQTGLEGQIAARAGVVEQTQAHDTISLVAALDQSIPKLHLPRHDDVVLVEQHGLVQIPRGGGTVFVMDSEFQHLDT